MAIRISRAVNQWSQLTYTSADSPDVAGRGGWGVKESTPDLTPLMVDRLMSGVSTRLEGVPELSKFPSDGELAARARRMAYRLDDGRVTLWHAVEAGNDASGRPGNVFAHVAVEPLEGTATRPIEYWRSTDWLVPFGASEVAKARIPSALRPEGAVSREAFLDFIEVGERLFVLRWLLDAVAWAVGTSSSAVLVTESADEAAGWLAAVSYLTAPQLAQRISFVTFERAHALPFAAQQGFRVICLPRVDLSRLDEMQDPFLLLDPHWDLDEREAAEQKAWRLPTGRSMPITQWPEWALDLASLDREHALAVLSAMDKLGSQMRPGAAVTLHWPLSVAMMLDEQSVIMARAEKLQEILAAAPAEMLDLPACGLLMDELVSGLDAEGWRDFLATNQDRAEMRELAALSAVARAGKLSGGDSDDVMEAARIASLLLDFELQPVPENDSDIPPLEPVLDLLKQRLQAPEFASRSEEVSRLNPQLMLDAPFAARIDLSGESLLRDQIADDIAEIFYEMPAGTDGCAVLARAVYVAAGLRPGVSPGVEDLSGKPFLAFACANSLVGLDRSPGQFLEHAKHILALTREPSMSRLDRQPGLSAAMQTVQMRLAVLQSVQQGACPTESMTVTTVAPLFRAREEAYIEALVHMFESGPGLEPITGLLSWVAHLIVASALALSLEQTSVLTIPTSGGEPLGWVVARRLVMKSGGFSRAMLRSTTDSRLLTITDPSTRDKVNHQISRLFDQPTPELRPVTHENTKRS
ncbi:MAG: hypothetical protein ABI903_10140 [Actinomycetota bacterium]